MSAYNDGNNKVSGFWMISPASLANSQDSAQVVNREEKNIYPCYS